MHVNLVRGTLAAGLSLALLAGAHLAGQLTPYGLPAEGNAAGDEAQVPAQAIFADHVLASVVTLYAERAVSEPVMIASGHDVLAEDANSDMGPQGWSWRAGSGFAVAEGGYILTNYHVVSGARRIEARLSDGSRVRAESVGYDPLTDLALVRIDARLPVLDWGDEAETGIGQPVFAVGSPLDFHVSVSAGVIGGFARAYDGADPVGYLQHDAALNPGNSGGPLIDASGRVIGVNTAIPQEAFFNVGISLAVPARTARMVADALLTQGRVQRGYLGVTVRALHGPLASALGRASGQGVLIEAVEPGSPAEAAGLRPGHTLLSVNGERLTAPRDLARALLLSRPGEEMIASVHDGQARIQMPVMLAARREAADPARVRDFGHRPRVGGFGIVFGDAPAGGGVMIDNVVPGSPAARAGLRAGDRVLAVGTVELSDRDEATVRLALARRDVALRVIRSGDGEPRFIALSHEPGTTAGAPDHAAFTDAAGGPF